MPTNCTKHSGRFVALAAVGLAAALTMAAAATTYHVDGDAGNDTNDGLLWSTALATLQKALDEAGQNPGPHQIWVAAWTYYPPDGLDPPPPDPRAVSFGLINAVKIYGGFENGDDFEDRDPAANVTILSGEIGEPAVSDNSYHVVLGLFGVGSDTLLDGFTIELGTANGTGANSQGGGIYLNGAQPEIRNCQIRANGAVQGGGAFVFDANPKFIRCAFEGNVAGDYGGAMYHDGGPFSPLSPLTLVNCDLRGNVAFGLGGAVYVRRAAYTMTNCLFSGNVASQAGGGAWVQENPFGDAFVTNCTFAGNTAPFFAGFADLGLFLEVWVTNCVFWDNVDGQIAQGDTIHVNYSLVEGGFDCGVTPNCGEGVIDDDPLFVDPANGDYRLLACSPCVDTGSPDENVIPDDQFDVDEDGDQDEPTPDLDLNDRVLDGDDQPGAIVDMGAYEFVPDPCPWDLNGDGVVGPADLAILLTNWDADPGGPPDFNCDGTVGPADLAALLTNWGRCPQSGGGEGGDGGGGDSEAALEAAVMQLGFESVPACQAWLIAASDGEAFTCGCILHALLAEHDD